MSYNTTIIEKIFRGHTMAVFANPPLPPLNGPLCSVSLHSLWLSQSPLPSLWLPQLLCCLSTMQCRNRNW